MTFAKESFRAWIESNGDVEFDLYAQDPNAWYELADMIPGLIVASAGGMLPFQAEGLIQGYPFYFRAEWGYAELHVGARDGEKPYLINSTLWAARVIGVEADTEPKVNFEKLLLMLVPKLEKASYAWHFPARKVNWLDDPAQRWQYEITQEWETNTVIGWGATAAEGYEASKEPSAYLAEQGFDAAAQRQLWLDREVQPIPSNPDTREYPAIMPDFRVLL